MIELASVDIENIIPAVAGLFKAGLVVHLRLSEDMRKEIDALPESKVIKRPGLIKILLTEALRVRKEQSDARQKPPSPS